MKINAGAYDRVIRIFIGLVLFGVWYLRLADLWQILAYIAGLFLLLNGITGRCFTYEIFKINTCPLHPVSKVKVMIFSIILIVFGWSGLFFTSQTSQTSLANDIHQVNEHYKEVVFYAERWNKDTAIMHYEKLMSVFWMFYENSKNHVPAIIKNDKQFLPNLENIKTILDSVKDDLYTWNLTLVVSKLNVIDNVLQSIIIIQ
ncbi:MAG: hypothetical protein ACD_80C00229G0001 [uncultured bacterium (gcode 4)]|uniref:Inner membrane protein YgaP-like transmembrane domain-containing protein n=1 Tax=uncultured bacterium (gcode 4) TaxID=1234023 RepID=K1X357_9BACT|nr:MAG: hypothetical protein ACD_80C00229G0001 [uncultured bacterium (gcode 4)]